ncbi:hypothetical protein Tco_0129266 [Tanacetum coccineum]
MTRNSNTKIFTPFDNPERQFHTRKNTTPLSVHNIYSFYESESSESESEETSVIDMETVTLEQYLALERGTTNRKERNPEDGNYEIKGQFLRELRGNTFDGNESKDAFKHLRKIQEIVSRFNTPGFSNEATMLKVFPITLIGTTKRWFERTPAGAVETWDGLKQTFIQRFCPPFVTFKRLGEIYNFRQDEGESLYQT